MYDEFGLGWSGVEWSGGCHENEKKVVLICECASLRHYRMKMGW